MFKAVIYAFNVDCPPPLIVEAKTKSIAVKKHNVIYRLFDDVKEEISARIPKRQEEELLGMLLVKSPCSVYVYVRGAGRISTPISPY